MRVFFTVAVFGACLAEPTTTDKAEALTGASMVTDFGAVCDGVTDDRVAIQAALDATPGGVVTVPARHCLIGKSPTGFYGIRPGAGTNLRGVPGSVLVQAVVPANTRLIEIDLPGITLDTLELDGQVALQTVSEHRAGVFAFGGSGLTIRNVVSHGFSGDGFTIHSGSDAVVLDNLTAYGNGRSGLAFTGCSSDASVNNLISYDNAVKALHTEPGAGCSVNDVTMTGGTLATGSADWALSIAGGSAALSSGWVVTGVTITGGVYVVGSTDVIVSGNTIRNAGTKPAVQVYRNADRVTVSDNVITASSAPAVVEVVGTDIANLPDHVVLLNNTITTATIGAKGVHAISARGLDLVGNTIIGADVASTYAYGVYARSGVPGAELMFLASGNTITNWGGTGLIVADTGGGVSGVSITGNAFYSASGAMRYAISVPWLMSANTNTAGSGVGLFAP